MERKLILNNNGFPNLFDRVEVTPEAEISKQTYIEQKIIESVNSYNPKLKIKSIIYEDLKEQFSHIKAGKYTGAIIEDLEITTLEEKKYKDRNYYIFIDEDKIFARKILLYVFISPPDESGRNNTISQTIFPEILDYVNDSIDTPTYTIAGHKFLFINIIHKSITSTMILRHIAGMSLIGIEYTEVFEESLDVKTIPRDLKEFLKKFDSKFDSNYDVTKNQFENDYYKIDFGKKIIQIKTHRLINSTITVNGRSNFKGSEEKFYWMEIYPITIFAYSLGYKVDYSLYTNYCDSYKQTFSSTSEKFARCETLLRYLNKYLMN